MAEKMSLGSAFDLIMLDPADISKLLQSLAVANSESAEMSNTLHTVAAEITSPPPVARESNASGSTAKQSKD
jgi:hypothetical protein